MTDAKALKLTEMNKQRLNKVVALLKKDGEEEIADDLYETYIEILFEALDGDDLDNNLFARDQLKELGYDV